MNQLELFTEIKIGSIYELDGISFRCEKIISPEIAIFQQLNKDGSEFKKYYHNSPVVFFNGRRIISKRIKELKLK